MLEDLGPEDWNTATWVRLKAYAEARRQLLREQNDRESLSHEKTCALRGRIAELSALIAMNAPPPEIISGSAGDIGAPEPERN